MRVCMIVGIRSGRRLRLASLLALAALPAAGPVAAARADDTTPPAPFSLIAPANGAYVATSTPLLTWNATTDATLYTYNVVLDAVPTGSATPSSCPAPATCSFQVGGTPDSPRLADGPHTWWVTAYDDWNNSTATSSRTFIVDTRPPTAPQITGATPQAVRWTPSSDAGPVTYQVSLDGTVVGATGDTSYASASADPYADHVWRVIAVDQAGNQTTSAPLSVHGAPRPTAQTSTSGAPGPPSGVAAAPTGGPSIVIAHGSRYTDRRTVRLAFTWPSDATGLSLSNGSIHAVSATWRTLAPTITWRLSGTGRDGHASTVSAAFWVAGGMLGTARSTIVLDLAKPTVRKAVRHGRSLRLWAADRVSGLARVQTAATRADPAPATAYRPVTTLGAHQPATWARVIDAAGNRSAWRRVATR